MKIFIRYEVFLTGVCALCVQADSRGFLTYPRAPIRHDLIVAPITGSNRI